MPRPQTLTGKRLVEALYLVETDVDAAPIVAAGLAEAVQGFADLPALLHAIAHTRPLAILATPALAIGLEALLREAATRSLSLILLDVEDSRVRDAAMADGAIDALPPGAPPIRLAFAIEHAAAVTRHRLRAARVDTARALVARLSKQERAVMAAAAGSLSTREAADRLGLSPRTIEAYRSNALKKLGAERLTAGIRYAIDAGLDLADLQPKPRARRRTAMPRDTSGEKDG